MTNGKRKARVAMIACGGTISSINRSNSRTATPTLSADELIDLVPQLSTVADLDPFTYKAAPSPHLNFEDIYRLRDLCIAAVGAGAEGVVVTMGTDTLEEVAFGLDILWGVEQPLVVTGAMRNPMLPGPDGPANLFAAACVAGNRAFAGQGVLVVFNDEVHAAPYVQKLHTTSVGTFSSPSTGRVGTVSEGRSHLVFRRTSRYTLPIETLEESPIPRVALLHMALGEDETALEYIFKAGYAGLVIAGFGGGHVSRGIAEGRWLDNMADHIPVVLSSRTRAGWLLEGTYGGFAGSETDLLNRGLISAGELDPFKARILLTICLAAGHDRRRIIEAFSLVGHRD
ncbi:MAG TPA: asparaginase [Thermomicrobiaceae bacterium]|nr:asparaginase [Thermomicrobiaceae bacterium]